MSKKQKLTLKTPRPLGPITAKLSGLIKKHKTTRRDKDIVADELIKKYF